MTVLNPEPHPRRAAVSGHNGVLRKQIAEERQAFEEEADDEPDEPEEDDDV